jgi:arylsulfatase
VIDAVAEMGELDNTLVIYIFGDNGASMKARSPARSTSSRCRTASR